MTDRLSPGQRLQVNDSLSSPSGQHSLVLQDDGNLVLYDQDRQPVWSSGTDGQSVAYAAMQDDGNVVLCTSADEPVWASDSSGSSGAQLVLQDDRNVVIYAADGTPIWATNTSA